MNSDSIAREGMDAHLLMLVYQQPPFRPTHRYRYYLPASLRLPFECPTLRASKYWMIGWMEGLHIQRVSVYGLQHRALVTGDTAAYQPFSITYSKQAHHHYVFTYRPRPYTTWINEALRQVRYSYRPEQNGMACNNPFLPFYLTFCFPNLPAPPRDLD
jgi:hypothetical protein